jgi:hypothetical protein
MALNSQALHTETGVQSSFREEVFPRPAAGRRRPNARRRVVLPVSEIEGAELQLPAVPVVRQARRFLALALMAGLFLLGYHYMTNPRYVVQLPLISGEVVLSDVQVSSIAGVRGKPILLVDPKAVKDRLESYPEIKAADVELDWPNEVAIRIEERMPVMSWMDSGRTWWISEDGIAFLGREASAALPHLVSDDAVLTITDDPMQPVIDPGLVRAVQQLNILIPELKEYSFSIDHGLGFVDPHGWQVYFGQGGDLSMKIVVYQAVVENLTEKGLVPEIVSVEQVTAPYYR